ncbi:MAG TPA: hypothetical protein PKC18_18300, partial [Lacipirellulaceae bacterium]|nr:hypothetical protein [Lacipirellulaceae bacterium]
VAAGMEAAPDVRLAVVDVGVRSPQNAALGPIETRRRVLRVGESLRLAVDVSAPAGGSPPLVELLTQDDEGRLQKRREALVEIDAEGRGRATFDLANLPLGTHQGAVQLAAADPLPADNTRYFTVEVRPPARVLLLAEDARAARFVREALAPSTGAASARFEVETGALADVSAKSFDEYQAVVLLDPGPIGEDVWLRLGDYVAAGGGLGVILGHQAVGHAAAFNGPAAQRLLPGKLARNSRDATYLRPRRLNRPALAGLRNYEEDIPWALCRVYRYWQLDDVAGDAYIVATLANDDPAIFDRGVGRGRVLTVTTPFSDPLQPEGREPWNVFASPEVAWPFVALCDQLIGYLSRDAEERLDYLAGETARVRLSPREQVTSFVVRTPDGQASSRVGGGDELSVSGADELGNYRLTAGGRSQRLDRGFSVNAAPDVSLLTRVDAASVVDSLPDNRAVLADDFTATAVSLAAGRSGRELYPWLIGLVAVVWGAEHLLANRFYRSPAPLDGSADK